MTLTAPPKRPRELIGGRFKMGKHIGYGTYGNVFAASDVQTGQIVALKKVKTRDGKNGLDLSTLNEIRVLAELDHPNIVKFIGAFPYKGELFIVSEFLPVSLDKLIMSGKGLSLPDIKCIMHQLLEGIKYLHDNWILHRDIKPQNILISTTGIVKYIDFGLAGEFPSDSGPMLSEMMTRWYRPPELIYGSQAYGPTADMWSVGCMFAEMIISRPLFPGNDDNDVLRLQTNLLGPMRWPGCDKLRHFRVVDPQGPIAPLKQHFRGTNNDTVDLLAKLLHPDPSRRITAEEALTHPYFNSPPEATIPSKLQLPENTTNLNSFMATTGMLTGFAALTNRVLLAPGTALLRAKEKK